MHDFHIKRVPIHQIDASLRLEIDDFVEQHQGTIYHETCLNSVSAENFGYNLSYCLAYAGVAVVGVMPCHAVREGLAVNWFSNLTRHDLVYGGWIYDHDKVELDQLLRATQLQCHESLQISSNIELSGDKPYRSSSFSCKTDQTVIIDLEGKSEDELFASFKHAQKNKIRKAEKLGVEIQQTGLEELDRFYSLLAELKDHRGKNHGSREYFRQVFSHYHALGRAACFIARHRNEDISTLMVLANRAFSTIWYGGRKMGIPNNLYQNELMIWEAIKWAKAFGSRYFDLCTVDEDRYPNLARIKLSFSKDLRPYYHYSIKKLPYKVLNWAQKRCGVR